MADHYFRFENGKGYISLCRFLVERRTDRGVWLDVWGQRMFVLDGPGKRYAYPTEDEAWESFKIRKVRQREHLTAALTKLSTIEKATFLPWREALQLMPESEAFELGELLALDP